MTYRWPTIDELVDLALDQADASARADLQEYVLLGCVLCADVIEKVWFLLGPGDFHDPINGAIWAACLRLRAEHRVEMVAVSEAVRHVPAAWERVGALVRQYLPGEEHRSVLLSCAAHIRRASVARMAATMARAA